MSLTKNDIKTIKNIVNESERRLEAKLGNRIDGLESKVDRLESRTQKLEDTTNAILAGQSLFRKEITGRVERLETKLVEEIGSMKDLYIENSKAIEMHRTFEHKGLKPNLGI